MKLALDTASPKKTKDTDWPVFVFKHHFYFNTSRHSDQIYNLFRLNQSSLIRLNRHELTPPTWINLIRDPITWFESSFYFRRLGWSRKPGVRSRNDTDLTVEQCIQRKHPDCTFSIWNYIQAKLELTRLYFNTRFWLSSKQFFCGNTPKCKVTSEATKKKSAILAKNNIEKNFYFIGILEEFMDSLKMFEIVMPRIFDGYEYSCFTIH